MCMYDLLVVYNFKRVHVNILWPFCVGLVIKVNLGLTQMGKIKIKEKKLVDIVL